MCTRILLQSSHHDMFFFVNLQSSSSSKLSAQRLHSAHGIQPLINNTKNVRKVRPRLKHQKKKYPYCLREKQKSEKSGKQNTWVSVCAHIRVQKHAWHQLCVASQSINQSNQSSYQFNKGMLGEPSFLTKFIPKTPVKNCAGTNKVVTIVNTNKMSFIRLSP